MSAVMLKFDQQRTKLLAISLGDEKWEVSRFYAQKVAAFSPHVFVLASSPGLRSFILSAPPRFSSCRRAAWRYLLRFRCRPEREQT